MSRPITDLLPDVLLSASGCPPMVATQALSSAVREFLTDTNVWKEWLSPIDVTAYMAAYTFDNHLGDPDLRWLRAKEVDTVRWAPTGRELEFLTHDQLQQRDREWRTRTGPVPCAYTYELRDADWGRTIRIYPAPDIDTPAALEARIVLTTHTYTGMGVSANDTEQVELPDVLFEMYRDAFVAGALGRLYKIPRRDWTDRREAAAQDAYFNAAKIAAKADGDMDHGPAVFTVAYGGL